MDGIELANWNWKVVHRFVSERFGISLSRSGCLNYPRLHGGRLCRGTARTSTAASDRVVHHSTILEFDFPSYRTDAAQQRGQAEEVDLQYYLTRDRRRKALRGPYHLGSRQHQHGLLHRLAWLPARRPGPLGASPPFPRMPPLDRIATGHRHRQGVGTAFVDSDRVE